MQKMILKNKDILLMHAYGQSYFDSKEIRAYGSLEALMASDILQGVPNREKSLTQLWEAAKVRAEQTQVTEETE